MPLFQLLGILAAIGFGTWLLVRLVPMSDPFKRIIIGVAVFVVFVLLLQVFGLLAVLRRITV